METIVHYFPDLTDLQKAQFAMLGDLYKDWNLKINVISRKDIEHLYTRHVLHSLAIAKVISFNADAKVLDVGTGGGFPGIPLAILFPETNFLLIDAIGKKITVVNAVSEALNLQNLRAAHTRAEAVKDRFDFIVSRAVTNMPDFVNWVKGKTYKENKHPLKNGILYLKGGDLAAELKPFPKAKCYPISDFFGEAFFETKSVVHLPM
ncbi:MAG: 16S rRNA (guanine(527)-N(7))-methyltransferase RsmG [Flavobacteriaceae bacterium]|nr:16S rRNA (guanine(527)-N(7))-methyltransferase RsmG [Flavobacteriaceae bacterium]